MDCLDNIIGVTETDCDCLLQGAGSDELSAAQTSDSGVFLDGLEGFNLTYVKSGDDDCARGGLFERSLKAIENAKQDFKTNFLACVGSTYKPRIDPLTVQLAGTTFSGSLNLSENYAGLKLLPMQVKGAFISLRRVGIMVNTSVPVVIKVFSNENDSTLIYTSSPINATANTLTWATLAEPLELPMWSYNTNIRYWVVYALDGTYQPKNTSKDCGCAGAQRPYLRWMDYEGTKGNDDSNMASFQGTNGANGLSLDIDIRCKTQEIICGDENPLDFENDPDSMGIAFAIRFRAAARLYSEVLSSTNINRGTLLDREAAQKQVNEWNGLYTDWVNFLCGNVENGGNGCWVCRDTATTLHKSTIRATR